MYRLVQSEQDRSNGFCTTYITHELVADVSTVEIGEDQNKAHQGESNKTVIKCKQHAEVGVLGGGRRKQKSKIYKLPIYRLKRPARR